MLPAGAQLSMEEKSDQGCLADQSSWTDVLHFIQQSRIEEAQVATEDFMKKLNEALGEIQVLKDLNEDLSKENEILKKDKIAQENLTAKANSYSDMLEEMLDQAREGLSNRPSYDLVGKMDELQDSKDRLQKEKTYLEDVVEEFKAMWSKDSNDFQETLKTVKEEGKALQQEVARLETLLADSQAAFADCYDTREVEKMCHSETKHANKELREQNKILHRDIEECRNEIQALIESHEEEKKARKETNETNELLLSEVRKHRSHLQDAETELHALREQHEKAEIKLAEQEAWMENQAVHLSSAISELFDSRQRADKQIQDAQECSRLKQDAYEQELAQIKKKMEEEKNLFESEKTELSVQLKMAENEVEALRYEFSYTVPALQDQLTMIRAECNTNYDHYVSFQNQSISLEQSLKQSQDERAQDRENFAATMDGVATQLNECKAALSSTMAENNQICAELLFSKEKVLGLQSEVSSIKNSYAELQNQLTSSEAEVEQLREQLADTLRETVVERERMEQKNEDSIAAMKKRCSQQIEEVKHNNMLAINQEMIKAQMALDSEKKKNALEYGALSKKWEDLVAAHGVNRQETSSKIATLIQEVITLRNHNGRIQSQCVQLQMAQTGDQAAIAKLKSDFRNLEQSSTEAAELHESKVNKLLEEHRKCVENMGVEELDDDEEEEEEEDIKTTEVKENADSSADWEVVDEE